MDRKDQANFERGLRDFTTEMTKKFQEKAAAGYTGWDVCDEDYLLARMDKNVNERDWTDVANLAFFLWMRDPPTEKDEWDFRHAPECECFVCRKRRL